MSLRIARCLDHALAVVLLLPILLSGCQSEDKAKTYGYETVATDPRRDTDVAIELNAKGAKHLKDNNLKEAERNLRAALTADMFYGPAHNNLGTVYYHQKRFYQAAWEFEYAVKLMPNKAQPKNNLGMVFEAVGKLPDAAAHYEEALKIEPDNVLVITNLARVYVREGRKDEKTRKLLQDIILKDTRPQWVKWAKEQLLSMK